MKAKKKLFIPIAMLVLAVMAMTSTTFAWFTSSTAVTGSMTNARVTSAAAMLYVVNPASLPTEIGLGATATNKHLDDFLEDQGNWNTSGATNSFAAPSALSMKDLTYVKPTEVVAGGIIDVDGTNITTASTPGLYKQGIYDAATDTDAKVSAVKGTNGTDFIDLTYTFWTINDGYSYNLNVDLADTISTIILAGTAKTIAFNDLDKAYFYAVGPGNEDVAKFYGTITPNAETSITSNSTTYYFNTGGSYSSNAANATRVMFSSVAQSGVNGDNTLGTITPIAIWDPNAGDGYAATAYPNIDIQDMFKKARLGDLTAPVGPNARYSSAITSGTPNTYTAAAAGDPPLLDLAATTNINTTTQLNLGTFASGVKNVTHGNDTYFRHQINVKIWLEGWDNDCFNVILGDAINVNLSFNTTINP